jgi:photosystem II stability/assembly factor-like uncharacterized protein
VYSSTDGGTVWSDITTTIGGIVYDVEIDPSSPNKVYAAGLSGIYRSTDNGATWNRNNGLAMGYRLAIDPVDPDVLYAGGTGACLKSTDGGVNWDSYTEGLCGDMSYGIAIDGIDADKVYMINMAGMFISDDNGMTWTPSNSGLLVSVVAALKLAPSSPNIIYAAPWNNPLHKTNISLGKASGSDPVVWDRLPAFPTTCTDIVDIEVDPGDPDLVYAFEGAG